MNNAVYINHVLPWHCLLADNTMLYI